MIASLFLSLLLTQVPPVPCDAGAVCSSGGFESSAGNTWGSGTPDFTCGHGGPDAPGGGANQYCVFRSRLGSNYSGYHGDFTFGNSVPRSAGWLAFFTNNYFGSGMPVFAVDFHGNLWSYGDKGLQLQENGAGVWNQYSYIGLRGASTGTYGDVVVQPMTPHEDGRWIFDVWNGSRWTFRARDDGALSINGRTFKFNLVDDTTLAIDVTRADGSVVRFNLSGTVL